MLAVPVEADAEVTVAEHVVHGAEAVVRAADLAAHERMRPVAFPGDAGHLEDAVPAHRADQLLGAVVRVLGHRERDVHGQLLEEPVGLVDEPRVRGVARRTGPARRRVMGIRDVARGVRVEQVHAAASACALASRSPTSQSAMLRT